VRQVVVPQAQQPQSLGGTDLPTDLQVVRLQPAKSGSVHKGSSRITRVERIRVRLPQRSVALLIPHEHLFGTVVLHVRLSLKGRRRHALGAQIGKEPIQLRPT
jgi:hypothetical protein